MTEIVNWYNKIKDDDTYLYLGSMCGKEGFYEKFGFVKASFLTAKRLLKCNPLFKPGYDPVPLTKEEKKQYENKENTSDDNE